MTDQELADAMFALVAEVQGKRKLKPGDLTKEMVQRHPGVDKGQCKAAIRLIIDSQRCVYTYFGGTYIELPHKEGAAEDA